MFHTGVIFMKYVEFWNVVCSITDVVSVFQVFQEEMGVVKSYNLKPGGLKIPVTRHNRKGESQIVKI